MQLLWHLLSDDKTVWQLVDGVVKGQLLLATAMALLLQVTAVIRLWGQVCLVSCLWYAVTDTLALRHKAHGLLCLL